VVFFICFTNNFNPSGIQFILNANNTVDNYWIRALPNRGNQGFAGGINSGILRYKGAPIADPTSIQTPSVNPLLENNLNTLGATSVPGQPVAGGADVAMNLHVSFGVKPGSFSINGVSFEAPSIPVLLQILSGATQASQLLPNGSVYGLAPNQVVELSLPGGAPGSPVSCLSSFIKYGPALILTLAFSTRSIYTG
jgi:iron transport multicopper oxidase